MIILRYEYGIQPGQLIEMDFHQMTEIQARNAFKNHISRNWVKLELKISQLRIKNTRKFRVFFCHNNMLNN